MENVLQVFYFVLSFTVVAEAYECRIDNDISPRVKLKQGLLEGQMHDLPNDRIYCSFKGIPYAKPPVGDLRFKAPQPPETWDGTFKAYGHGENCPQVDYLSEKLIRGQENCLTLNVYTPQTERDALVPVMVWIHGGGFISGSGDSFIFGPDPLILHDIVIVTINYRLGALGFLSLDTPEVPGNAGLKDQVAALRWVKENIAKFNGNPNNITIFGADAGGVSVSYHLVSPMSKGLFHNAIVQSGTFMVDWTFTVEEQRRAFYLGMLLGQEINSTDILLNFLQSVSYNLLVGVRIPMIIREEFVARREFFSFLPVVEKVHSDQTFLEQDPVKLIEAGKIANVPIMMGLTTAEGLALLEHHDTTLELRSKYLELAVPRRIAWNLPLKLNLEIGKKIQEFYFETYGKKDLQSLMIFESDTNINYPFQKFANLVTSKGGNKIFYYIFDCDSDRNIMKVFSKMSDVKGVMQGDDVSYLFQSVFHGSLNTDSETFRLVNRTTALWTNFAYYGNPTPTDEFGVIWDEYTSSERKYLYMANTLERGAHPDKERYEFWMSIEDEVKAYL